MEIRVKKEIIDGFLVTTLTVENPTLEEQNLFKKYGEPIINIGGTIEKIYLDAPILLYPDIDETNISINPTLTWESVNGATSYFIQIADNLEFNNPQEYTSLTESKDVSLLNDNNYYWRVAAVDSIGTGPWSNSQHFTTIAGIPSAPILYTPDNNSTDIPINVLFTWEPISFNINPITYDIEIAIDNSFVTIVDSHINLSENNYTSSLLGNITQYYWRVRAKNVTGNSNWSNIFHFTTIIPAPEPPILTTPVDGELNGLSHQAFDWEDTTYANSYHFQLSNIIDFSSIYIDQEFISVSSYTVSDEFTLTNGNTYYWRVRALGDQGYSNWSEIRTLTINDSLVPSAPLLTFPADNATDVNPVASIFYWETSERADEYTFQISSINDFSIIDLEQSPAGTSIEVFDLNPNSVYYWRVNAVNYIYGTSDWSSIRSFTTEIVTPNIPTLNTPANASTSTTDLNNFSWNIADRATTYDFQIANDAGFTSIISNQTGLVTAFAQYTFSSNTTYYWRVRSNNSYGTSDWATYRSIIINATYALNPSQVTSNNFWVRSDLGITLTSSRVSTWADQSSGGSNLTQATSTRRPVISAAAYNGIQSVYFNPDWTGLGETLSYNDSSAKYSFTSANSVSFMFTFMTDGTKLDFNSSYFSPFTRANTNYGQQFSFIRGVNTGPGSYQLGYPYPAGDYLVVPLSLNIPHQIIVVKSATNHKVYLDGNKIGEVTKTPTSFAVEGNTYLNVGSTYNTGDANGKFTGHFFEAAWWTKLLSASEIASLYKYHKERYGV